jgi:hypothetical protein
MRARVLGAACYGGEQLDMLCKYCTLASIVFAAFFVCSLEAVAQAVRKTDAHGACASTLKSYEKFACSRKEARPPTHSSDLALFDSYPMSIFWAPQLVKLTQELYEAPPKNLKDRVTEVMEKSTASCPQNVLVSCQKQALLFFGVEKSRVRNAILYLTGKKKYRPRNETLAAALGESFYEADIGELISRYIDIKTCEQLKADAKVSQCVIP